MIFGPMIGNGINSIRNIPLPDAELSPDSMTTLYIPAPEIFLAASIFTLLLFAIIPLLRRAIKKQKN